MKDLQIISNLAVPLISIVALMIGWTIGTTRAEAAVLSTTGTIVLDSDPYPPESDSQIFVFDEQQGVSFVSTQPLDFGSIAPGTLVNSHYLQFDTLSPTGFIGTGSVTFDAPILGVVTSTENLNADLNPDVNATSDSYFGLETLLGPYPTGANPNDRGLGSPEDDLAFILGENILVVNSLEIPVPNNLDGFRVITAVVPLPPAVYLFGSGLLGLIGVARRKKAA